jgi:hypothetical protein
MMSDNGGKPVIGKDADRGARAIWAVGGPAFGRLGGDSESVQTRVKRVVNGHRWEPGRGQGGKAFEESG